MGLHRRANGLFVDHDGNEYEAVVDPYRLAGMDHATIIIGWPYERLRGWELRLFDDIIKSRGYTVDRSKLIG
jgi:hypothetical protein